MNVKDQWRALAQDLGFEFKQGMRALLESPSLISLMGNQVAGQHFEQAKALLDNPVVQGLLDKVFTGAATGTRHGYEFVLYRSTRNNGSGASSRVNVALILARDLGLGLKIKRAGPWSALGRFLMPGSYLPFGSDLALGAKLKATARDKAGATALLATPEMLAACSALFARPGRFKITDHALRWKENGHVLTKARAEEIMDHMAAAADHLPAHVTRFTLEPASPAQGPAREPNQKQNH